jgi:Zn-dependent protease/CBS domain-containing protein
MRGAFRIGRLFGVNIGVDWSWSLIFLLVTWNLTAVFVHRHPDWPVFESFVLAVVAALLFFASVLAHELAHSVVAKSFGVNVREIRLFLFGGIANLDREPPSARAELWTAIVGPLVSLALGAFFLVLAAISMPAGVDPTNAWEAAERIGPIPTLLFWLGPINILVGVFNLIPGFPLDGGRILRAAIWRVTGDLHKATFAASTCGRVIGWVFIALGIAMVFGARIPFFGQGPISGIWLAFIGWFLSSAAQRSYGAMLVQDVLEGVTVSTLMRRTGWVIAPDTPVRSVVNDWFMRSRERSFPVTQEDGALVGIITIEDVHRVGEDAWSSTTVRDVMTPKESLAVVSPGDEALTAVRKFSELDVDELPVVENDRLVGMLGRSDLARWLELHSAPHGRTARPGGPPFLRPA